MKMDLILNNLQGRYAIKPNQIKPNNEPHFIIKVLKGGDRG